MREISATETPDPNAPVDLDQTPEAPSAPPSPELARWSELAKPDPYVLHDGDASEVMPMPRPAWADPEADHVDYSLLASYYRSEIVRVPVSEARGELTDGGDGLEQASVNVSVKMFGNGAVRIPLTLRKFHEFESGRRDWYLYSVPLTPAEAADVARVLLAAADLAVSE